MVKKSKSEYLSKGEYEIIKAMLNYNKNQSFDTVLNAREIKTRFQSNKGWFLNIQIKKVRYNNERGRPIFTQGNANLSKSFKKLIQRGLIDRESIFYVNKRGGTPDKFIHRISNKINALRYILLAFLTTEKDERDFFVNSDYFDENFQKATRIVAGLNTILEYTSKEKSFEQKARNTHQIFDSQDAQMSAEAKFYDIFTNIDAYKEILELYLLNPIKFQNKVKNLTKAMSEAKIPTYARHKFIHISLLTAQYLNKNVELPAHISKEYGVFLGQVALSFDKI